MLVITHQFWHQNCRRAYKHLSIRQSNNFSSRHNKTTSKMKSRVHLNHLPIFSTRMKWDLNQAQIILETIAMVLSYKGYCKTLRISTKSTKYLNKELRKLSISLINTLIKINKDKHCLKRRCELPGTIKRSFMIQ